MSFFARRFSQSAAGFTPPQETHPKLTVSLRERGCKRKQVAVDFNVADHGVDRARVLEPRRAVDFQTAAHHVLLHAVVDAPQVVAYVSAATGVQEQVRVEPVFRLVRPHQLGGLLGEQSLLFRRQLDALHRLDVGVDGRSQGRNVVRAFHRALKNVFLRVADTDGRELALVNNHAIRANQAVEGGSDLEGACAVMGVDEQDTHFTIAHRHLFLGVVHPHEMLLESTAIFDARAGCRGLGDIPTTVTQRIHDIDRRNVVVAVGHAMVRVIGLDRVHDFGDDDIRGAGDDTRHGVLLVGLIAVCTLIGIPRKNFRTIFKICNLLQ